MLYRCPKCRYSGNNLDALKRHVLRHDNPAPKVLTENLQERKKWSDTQETD